MQKHVNEGGAPALVNDDTGHWAVSGTGAQNVACSEEPIDIWTEFYIEKDMWADTAPMAICKYILKLCEDGAENVICIT